jgi:hypothetical protein
MGTDVMYFIDIMPSYCGIELLLIGSAMTLIFAGRVVMFYFLIGFYLGM